MERPRIIIADDHPQVVVQLRQLLSRHFDVVATAANGRDLVGAAMSLKPDVVVTDICMPEMDGLQAASAIGAALPSTGIVFITVHDNHALALKAMKCGQAYVLKSAAGEDLLDAMTAVLSGARYVSPTLRDVSIT
jgi:DNA-binding NarL/FixJ family response regulator